MWSVLGLIFAVVGGERRSPPLTAIFLAPAIPGTLYSSRPLFLAVYLLAALVAFLGFHRQRGDGPSVEAL